ncbi:carbon-monoxide dehydrogenase medium subunit [Inquilinus ginsengisoli]|uniref:FAD binding domain-containing protein n=1 Tax=Inquilinus ginsengisoli TaxID=363840 RepID=UPI003D200097
MHPTRYHRVATVAEAARLFAGQEDPSYLSGGHTLLPTMKLGLRQPSDLIDLGRIEEMRGIEVEGGILSIGAATRHAETAASPLVRRHIPALAGMAGSIGDRHVRHRGTMGGSVANNDPAADYPAAVLGLGATVVTDRRRIPADDFFTGLYETALEPGEIITRIDYPIPDSAGYAKFRSPASRFAIAAAFVVRTGGAVRVAVTGAGSGGVFRACELEDALSRDFSSAALAACRIDPDLMLADQNGTPEYRANLAMVMARRAVDAMGEARSYK